MKFFKIIIFLFFISPVSSNEVFKLKKITDLNNPWSLTFISEKEVLVSDKEGQIQLINIQSGLKQIVQHNLNNKFDGQGGLLEILKNKEDIYICYTEDRNLGKTSTSIAKAKYSTKNLNFKNIFQANPPINSGYHFGCRMVIQDN